MSTILESLTTARVCDLPLSLAVFEYVCITRALREHDGDVKKAARALAIGRSTLYRRLRSHETSLRHLFRDSESS